MGGGNMMEEDGVPGKFLQQLLDFETDGAAKAGEATGLQESLYKVALVIKEHGNQLFKLKDYEAAHEEYTSVINAFCVRPLSGGEQVLIATQKGSKPELVVAT